VQAVPQQVLPGQEKLQRVALGLELRSLVQPGLLG
jgi:hypothetical protein